MKYVSQGIIIHIDDKVSFDEVKSALKQKCYDGADFFKDAKVAIAFEGRTLSEEEESELLAIIDKNTNLKVLCVIDKKVLVQKNTFLKEKEQNIINEGLFFKGNLRSGQLLESEKSIIVIGNVEPGAHIISNGNVIILGRLKGNVYAGANKDINAFVAALYMEPIQIKIGNYIRKSRIIRSNMHMRPKICMICDGKLKFQSL